MSRCLIKVRFIYFLNLISIFIFLLSIHMCLFDLFYFSVYFINLNFTSLTVLFRFIFEMCNYFIPLDKAQILLNEAEETHIPLTEEFIVHLR